MKPYHAPRRMFTPVLACVLASAVALAAAMTVDPGPAQASPAHAGTPGIASNNALAQVPMSAAGFTCRGFPPECGYLFSKHATKVVMKAAAAGGVVAAATACNAIPGVSELVCSVIGAVSGVTLGDLASGYTEGTCLFVHTSTPIIGHALDLVGC